MLKISVTPCIIIEGIAIPISTPVLMEAEIGGSQGIIHRLEIPEEYRES